MGLYNSLFSVRNLTFSLEYGLRAATRERLRVKDSSLIIKSQFGPSDWNAEFSPKKVVYSTKYANGYFLQDHYTRETTCMCTVSYSTCKLFVIKVMTDVQMEQMDQQMEWAEACSLAASANAAGKGRPFIRPLKCKSSLPRRFHPEKLRTKGRSRSVLEPSAFVHDGQNT
jgi:hypothetical protein